MSDIEDDIKATAGAIMVDASTITAIEDEKITLDADDPLLADLSAQAEEVATDLLEKAKIERELVAEASQRETQTPSR